MKKTNSGMTLAALVLLQMLWVGSAHSQPVPGPGIKEEMTRQEAIYSSRGEQVPEGYVIDRSLLSYTFTLPSEFDRSLAELGPDHRWLDVGAGRGQAILDYYAERYDSMHREGRERRGKKARSVAMSIEDRRTPAWYETAAGLEPMQIRYLFGKRLREYSREELGRFQVITDVLGGFSYTEDLSRFAETVLDLLEPQGTLYTVLQDVRAEAGNNQPFYPGARFLTEILDVDGSEVKMCSWLKNISCVEVTCEFKPEWKPHIEVYRVKKVCSNVSVPALVPVHFEAGTPPERRFRLQTPLPVRSGNATTTR